MDKRYRVKRGDTPGIVRGTLSDHDGPVDISTASEVRLLIRKRNAPALKVSAVVTNEDDGTPAARGRWSYTWAPADLDTAGTYDVEVQVTWADGDRITFPTHGHNELVIEGDLG